MTNYHYLNGQWVTDDDVKISAFDLTVLRGFGTFDYLRTYNYQPFRLEDHLDRFERSNSLLGITIPASREQLKEAIAEGIKRNDEPNIGIRMITTGGIGPDSMTPGEPSLIMLFQAVSKPEDIYYTEGAKAMTYATPRHLPQAKTLNYLMGILAVREATERGCLEAIYVDAAVGDYGKRRIYEGTRTNFFAVVNGKIVTPADDMLAGVTRKVIIELAESEGIDIVQDNLFLEDVVDNFEEAFISSSDKEIIPIVAIDDLVVGSGQPGPVTRQLMDAFERKIKQIG